MKDQTEGILLRIFVGESDQYEGRPLYEQIVHHAHACGLAGATVVRGLMGFGSGSRIHTAKLLRLSEDLPVVVEIVDREERIERMMPFLDEAIREGLVTRERVQVVAYRPAAGEARDV